MSKKTAFLAGLPTKNPESFTATAEKPKDEDKVRVAYDVPKKQNEQKITNDIKPSILRFLENHYPKTEEPPPQSSKKRSVGPSDQSPKHKKAARIT